MVDVQVEIDIAKPRDEVADFVMEAENDPRWLSGISSARRLTPPPTGIGTRVERIASFRGKRIEYVMDVVQHVPGRRIVLKTVKGPFPMTITYDFDDRDGGSVARTRIQGEGKGYYRLAGPLMNIAVKRQVARDLKTLKRLIETGST